MFGDTDADVTRKIHAAYAAGLAPIACIGETLDEREAGRTFDVLDTQLKAIAGTTTNAVHRYARRLAGCEYELGLGRQVAG